MNEIIKTLRESVQHHVRQFYTPNRSIALNKDTFSVKMQGLNALASLHKSSSFAYNDIESVTVGSIDGISLFAPRLGYSNPLTGARAGRFRTKGRHILASFSNPSADILTITLRQQPDDLTKFDMIMLQVENPCELASEIKKRMK